MTEIDLYVIMAAIAVLAVPVSLLF